MREAGHAHQALTCSMSRAACAHLCICALTSHTGLLTLHLYANNDECMYCYAADISAAIYVLFSIALGSAVAADPQYSSYHPVDNKFMVFRQPACQAKHNLFTRKIGSPAHSPSITVTLADMAIAYIFWEEFGIMATDPGYGYFRPSINLFDPGWRLTPDGHDTGTHAAAVMDRQAQPASHILQVKPLPLDHCCLFVTVPMHSQRIDQPVQSCATSTQCCMTVHALEVGSPCCKFTAMLLVRHLMIHSCMPESSSS